MCGLLKLQEGADQAGDMAQGAAKDASDAMQSTAKDVSEQAVPTAKKVRTHQHGGWAQRIFGETEMLILLVNGLSNMPQPLVMHRHCQGDILRVHGEHNSDEAWLQGLGKFV